MRITLSNRTHQELSKEITYARHLGRYKQELVYRCILILNKGYTISEIANIFGKYERIVYYLISCFLLNGVKGLRYNKIKGSLENGYDSFLWTSATLR